jgi:hypothetical protein
MSAEFHEFQRDLEWSTRSAAEMLWERVWTQHFGIRLRHMLAVGDLELQRAGVDRILVLRDSAILVDEKERRSDFDDVLLEVYSRHYANGHRVDGWAIDDSKVTHLIAYAVPRRGLCWVFEAPVLRQVTRKNMDTWHEQFGGWKVAQNRHYSTLSLAVPTDILLAAYAAEQCLVGGV